MPIPTYAVGQVLGAADCSLWFVPLEAHKTADLNRASNITLTNDPDLVLTVAANATYRLECLCIVTGVSGGDFQWGWAVPASATMRYQALHNEGGATGLGNSSLVNSEVYTGFAACSGTGTNTGVQMWGEFTTAGTAGNLQLKWAQQTSNGTATTMKAGSSLMLRRTG